MERTTVRNLSTTTTGIKSSRQSEDTVLSERQILEMRVELLSQQDMKKIRDAVELVKILHSLLKAIKEAVLEVRKAAREVKGYPVEVITTVTARMEQCLSKCEQAAKRAQATYEIAQQFVIRADKTMAWWVVSASIMTSGLMALLLMLFWSR